MTILMTTTLTLGIWRAVLTLPERDVPFNVELKKGDTNYTIDIINSDERLLLNNIVVKSDSLFARFPVYDSEIRLKFTSNKMTGEWVNYSRKANQSIPFNAIHGLSYRFINTGNPSVTVSGKWQTWFSPGSKDSSLAIGIFNQTGNKVTGTFLTSTGDYRYLDGSIINDSMFLSCFDGAHAYLFKAKLTGNKFQGFIFPETIGKKNG